MTDQIRQIESIRAEAIKAAERGDLPTVCPYLRGTPAEYQWKDSFYTAVYRLSGEATA